MARMCSWVLACSLKAQCGIPAHGGASSGKSGSRPMAWTTSMRNPSTPRSSQKRMTPCMASTTSGLSQFRSGCWGRNWCRYHCSVAVVPGPGPTPFDEGARPSCWAARRARRRRATRTSPAWGRPGCCRDGLEPRVLVGAVVGHEVHQDPDAEGVGVGHEAVEGGEVAEERVDVAEVGHVVAEVGHGGAVERRQPDGVDPQPGQVVEPLAHALEVADAVAVGVGEGPGVDLVDDAGSPPGSGGGGGHGRQTYRPPEVRDVRGSPRYGDGPPSPLRASGAVP